MKESNMQIILESLAETIQELSTDVQILRYENKRLKEKIAVYESPVQEVGKNND